MRILPPQMMASRVRRAQSKDPHLRRLRSLAHRQRRGLRDYRRYSMAYRSAMENSRTRLPKVPGAHS